ncbi:DUF2777 family protein [Halalkalibacter urbisdiaboli]|uniref:DUF2777 family protein n=1 Tax=Halalkalibacter urbisdiaboli TaxID=1960589 RepID=UPI000B45395F|nr:DUF2777 family protein [Halalkalibacter urbisdiaboli]
MDRKQAQSVIGQKILIEEGLDGSYVGELLEVIAEPRKPWRGKVRVIAVITFPDSTYENGNVHIREPKYKENELIECPGSRLHSEDVPDSLSYSQSVVQAIDYRIELLRQRNNQIELEIEQLNTYLTKNGLQSSKTVQLNKQQDQDFVEYSFHKKGKRFVLIDQQGEQLDLEDCPLEFNWRIEGNLTKGFYVENGTFKDEDGTIYSPNEGDFFYINKEQFDPYFILRNELEQPALESLEKSLQAHGLSHDDITHCHNSLLGQLLYSQGKTEFKGVNFLTYKGKQGIVMVQHHYERTLVDSGNDEIYDRFEFTTELGKRSIVTYTNEFSR